MYFITSFSVCVKGPKVCHNSLIADNFETSTEDSSTWTTDHFETQSTTTEKPWTSEIFETVFTSTDESWTWTSETTCDDFNLPLNNLHGADLRVDNYGEFPEHRT